MKRKLYLMLVVLMMFSIIASGCGGATEEETVAEPTADIVVGMVQIGTDNPFWVGEVEGANEAARRHGFQVTVTSGQSDVNKQVQAFEDLVNAGVDVITLNPIDSNAFGPAFDEAKAAGIPIICLHTWIDGCSFRLGFDEWYTGRGVGEYALRLLEEKYGAPEGNVAILLGMLGQDVNEARAGGFTEVLNQYPGVNIVAQEPTNWDPKRATEITENWLTAYPELEMIYGLSDSLTVPAANVVQRSDLVDQILLVSVDGTESGLNAVKEGLQESTFILAPQYTGFWYAYAGYLLSIGVEFPENVLIQGALVTEDNVDAMLQLSGDQHDKITTFPFEMPFPSIVTQYSQ